MPGPSLPRLAASEPGTLLAAAPADAKPGALRASQSESSETTARELTTEDDGPPTPHSGSLGHLDATELCRGLRPSLDKPEDRVVWLHIYHCDPYTGFLNRALLKQADVGIYHAGIEVYGEEFSFQYFEDTWHDPTVSGLIRCLPRRMSGYEFQESVSLGRTALTPDGVDQLLASLHRTWPACSYHLTRNNCLTFAEHFAERLGAPEPFPARLKGILEASRDHPSLEAAVDCGWSWSKWWMQRRHRPRAEEPGVWALLLQSTQTCSPSLCAKSARISREHSLCPEPAMGPQLQ